MMVVIRVARLIVSVNVWIDRMMSTLAEYRDWPATSRQEHGDKEPVEIKTSKYGRCRIVYYLIIVVLQVHYIQSSLRR